MNAPSDGEPDRSILLIEDEVLLALDMQDRLEGRGYRVLGPAGSVEKAHDVLDNETPDAAVLDVNLNGRSVAPVARRLREHDVPCLLVTAYGREDLSNPALADLPLLSKPATTNAISQALEDILN